MGRLNTVVWSLVLAVCATAFAQEQAPAANLEVFSNPGFAAVYLDAEGNLAEFADEDLRAERFVFHAWLQNREEQGIDLENENNVGQPTPEEQTEVAPSFTQNLAAGFVGYRAENGEVYPVAGAQVRWVFDRQFSDAQGSMMFGAADAASAVPGVEMLGILGDQALTLTNNGNLSNQARFPVATDYPLHNVTGVGSPDTDGFTWVTLFSPDEQARARIVAVASVNGVEIGKEVLTKNFAPSPELAIEKTVDRQTVNLGVEGQGTVTFTVRVTNTGRGAANNVVLEDELTSGNRGAYTIVQGSVSETGQGQQSQSQPSNNQAASNQTASNQPANQSGNVSGGFQSGGAGNAQNGQQSGGQQGPGNDGFTRTFNLPAGESRTFTFEAQAGETANYCNTARISNFESEFGQGQQDDLSAQACFEALRPELALLKDFIDQNGESLGDNVTVSSGEQARLRVRVVNQGDAPAQNVTLTDALTSGEAQAYSLMQAPEGATQEGAGFSADIGTLEPEAARTFTFPVQAEQDGEYCDTATLAVDGEQRGQQQACLRVATPQLEITKNNDLTTVLPGTTYESTVTVRNTGSAPARGVLLSDTVAANQRGATLAPQSAQLGDAAGVFDEATNIITAATAVDIPPGEAVALRLVTRAPVGVSVGRYCNIGRFESDNAGEGEVEACVEVPAYLGLQNEFTDTPDPIVAGANVVYTASLLNEPRANEAATDHNIVFTYGVLEGRAGAFEIVSTRVYINEDPLINTETGALVSASTSGVELAADQDYTLQGSEPGAQNLTINRPLQPGSVIFVIHEVSVPQDVQAGEYTSSFQWSPTGASSGTEYQNGASEPTTVITQ